MAKFHPSDPVANPQKTTSQIKLIDSGVDHDLPSDAACTGADGWFSNSRVPPHGDAWFVPDQHL